MTQPSTTLLAPPAPHIPRAAVIYNPTKVDGEDIRRAVADEEAAAGWAQTLWYETSLEDPGQGVAQRALDDGATVIIAAGGDGTVRAVAEVVRGTGTALALLPSGTGNLLARNLHLTLDDLDHSIRSAFTGRDRAIDVAMVDIRREDGSVDRHAYLVMAGLGLDAKMLASTDDELKAKAGWLAYVKAIGTVISDKNRLRFQYHLDGHRMHSVRAHTIIVGNCGSLPANILLLPDAAIDDGLLDVVILRPESVAGWVQIATKVFWENGVLSRTRFGRRLRTGDVDALNYLRGARLTVRLREAEEIELDGDSFGRAVALRTWCEPGGVIVRVPAEEV